jgi:hypothetical protein
MFAHASMSEQTLRQRNGNDGKDRSARPSSLQGYLNRRITLPFAILSDLRRYDDKNLAIKAPDFFGFFPRPEPSKFGNELAKKQPTGGKIWQT